MTTTKPVFRRGRPVESEEITAQDIRIDTSSKVEDTQSLSMSDSSPRRNVPEQSRESTETLLEKENSKFRTGSIQAKMPYLLNTPKSAGDEDGKSEIMRLFNVTKIAKAVKHMQRDRQRKLAESGNISLYSKLRKFDHANAEIHVKEILDNTLFDESYNQNKCRVLTLEISNTIRNTMKSLQFPRYKFVAFVTIGQKDHQSVTIASRCIWNTGSDDFVTVKYENSTLFAVATVYAMFCE